MTGDRGGWGWSSEASPHRARTGDEKQFRVQLGALDPKDLFLRCRKLGFASEIEDEYLADSIIEQILYCIA